MSERSLLELTQFTVTPYLLFVNVVSAYNCCCVVTGAIFCLTGL